MASLGRLARVTRLFQRVSCRHPAQLSYGSRGVKTTPCRRYQETKTQSSEIPADRYQRTTITEDAQRAATHEAWEDPRSSNKVNLEGSSDGSVIDPTIRHFTVNFVPI